ncbi:unnamed protein product [Symbiodinium microadriaticum]|nr:unnamed protein product [Symbiodinium microadriaticum]
MSWQSGVVASFLGSLTGTLGTQLRISSLTTEVTARAQFLAVCGWGFWGFGQLLGQVAILLAPASLTASVNFSGSLLSNAVLAPFVLNERLTKLHWLSMLLLVVGSGMVTSSSSHADQKYSYLQLCQLAHRPTFLTCAIAFAVLSLLLACHALKRRTLELLSFAYLFALIGAIDLLVTKFTLQLLRLVVVGKRDAPAEGVVTFFTVMTLTLHVGVFGCQVAAAYYRKALTSLPLFLGSGALMQVIVCGTFFDEFHNFGLNQQLLSFGSGLLLVMTGMICTSVATSSFREEVPASAPTTPEDPDMEAGKGTMAVQDVQTRPRTPSNVSPSSNRRSAVITSGLLERSSSSMSSADLLLLGDIQRSALCFGGRIAVGRVATSKISLHRRFASDNFLLMPLASHQDPDIKEGRLGRAASAPPGTEPMDIGILGLRREASS